MIVNQLQQLLKCRIQVITYYNRMQIKIQDSYNIKSKIGNGNFSIVYIATSKQDPNREVAIKVMNTHLSIGVKQANILKKLNHPNIIKIFDFQRSKTQEELKIVMEYIPQNILQLYQSQKFGLREQQVKCILFQCALGLSHIHQKGIIHRDIKPQNILIDKKKAQIKIIDFGLAAFTYIISTDYVATRWYRAPQNLLGTKQYTTSIDIFSLGCVIVQLYLGNPLFPGSDNVDQLYKILNIIGEPTLQSWPLGYQTYARLSLKLNYQSNKAKMTIKKLLESCNQDFIQIIQKMLVLNPAKRITANQLINHKYFQDIKAIVPPQVYQRFQGDILSKNNREKRGQRFRFLSQQKNNQFIKDNYQLKKHIKSQKNLLAGQKIEGLKNRIETVICNIKSTQKKPNLKNQGLLQYSTSLRTFNKPLDQSIKTIQKINKDYKKDKSPDALNKSIEKYQLDIKKLNQKMETLKFHKDDHTKDLQKKSNIIAQRQEVNQNNQPQRLFYTVNHQTKDFAQKQIKIQNNYNSVQSQMLSFRGLNHPFKKTKLSIKQLVKKNQIKPSIQKSRSNSQNSQSLTSFQKIIADDIARSKFDSPNQKYRMFYPNPSPSSGKQMQNINNQTNYIQNNEFGQQIKQNQDVSKFTQKQHYFNNFAKSKVSRSQIEIQPQKVASLQNSPNNYANNVSKIVNLPNLKERSVSIQKDIIYRNYPPTMHQNSSRVISIPINQVTNRSYNQNDSQIQRSRKISSTTQKYENSQLHHYIINNNSRLIQPPKIYRQNKIMNCTQGNVQQVNQMYPINQSITFNQNQNRIHTNSQQKIVYFNRNSNIKQNLNQQKFSMNRQLECQPQYSNQIYFNTGNLGNSLQIHNNRSIQNKLKLVASRDFQKTQQNSGQQQKPLIFSMPINPQQVMMKQSKQIKMQQNQQKQVPPNEFLRQIPFNYKRAENKSPILDSQKLIYSNNKISLKSSKQFGLAKIKSQSNLAIAPSSKQIYKYVQIKQKLENFQNVNINTKMEQFYQPYCNPTVQKDRLIYNQNILTQLPNNPNNHNQYLLNNNNVTFNNNELKFSQNRFQNNQSNIPITHTTKSLRSLQHRQFYAKKPLPSYNNNARFSFDINQQIKLNYQQDKIKKSDTTHQFLLNKNQGTDNQVLNNFQQQNANSQDPQNYRSSFGLNNLRQSIKNFIPDIIYMQKKNKQQEDINNLPKQKNNQRQYKQENNEQRNFCVNDNISSSKSEKNININLNLKIYNAKKQ